MNYLTDDMARAIDSDVPYHDLAGYWKWRGRVDQAKAHRSKRR